MTAAGIDPLAALNSGYQIAFLIGAGSSLLAALCALFFRASSNAPKRSAVTH
jgi:hypothetical protein